MIELVKGVLILRHNVPKLNNPQSLLNAFNDGKKITSQQLIFWKISVYLIKTIFSSLIEIGRRGSYFKI